MTSSNIQRFDEVTGQLLSALYESFPLPRSLLIEDFPVEGNSSDKDTNGRFFLACVDWLSNADYLRTNGRDPRRGYTDVVLTAKGLEVLKAVPERLQTSLSLGETLVSVSKEGTKEVLRGVVSEVLSLGARLVTTHLGLPG